MEVAESGVTLGATGLARKVWPGSQGDYSITKREHRDRPVYRNSWGYLYSSIDGGWAVSSYVGDSKPVMRSTSPALSPALCQHWEYSESENGGEPWKDEDIMVTYTKVGSLICYLSPCPILSCVSAPVPQIVWTSIVKDV